MPRYYFHVRRGQVTTLDHDGAELADINEAAREAARRGREIVARDALQGIVVIVVTDDQWRPLVEVPLQDTTDSLKEG
jgi:hypothetical protein